MLLTSRLLVTLIGLLSLFSVYQHWFDLTAVREMRGLTGSDGIGAANIRADIGGLFLAISVFAFIAAWKRSTTWLLATILLPALAFLGRVISLAIDGSGPGIVEPMIVEAVVLTLLGACYLYWKKTPEGL
jgi:hypothetical protein